MKCRHVLLMDTSGSFTLGIKLLLTKQEIDRRYRERHPDRVKQARRNWRNRNKQHRLEYQREYRLKKRKQYLRGT